MNSPMKQRLQDSLEESEMPVKINSFLHRLRQERIEACGSQTILSNNTDIPAKEMHYIGDYTVHKNKLN